MRYSTLFYQDKYEAWTSALDLLNSMYMGSGHLTLGKQQTHEASFGYRSAHFDIRRLAMTDTKYSLARTTDFMHPVGSLNRKHDNPLCMG